MKPKSKSTPPAWQFEAALNFFVRSMRYTDFVRANMLLLGRYGDKIHSQVTEYCWEHGITYRGKCGRLLLHKKYARPLTRIKLS